MGSDDSEKHEWVRELIEVLIELLLYLVPW